MESLATVNRFLVHLLLVLSALALASFAFGCTRPPAPPVAPAPSRLFSPSPPALGQDDYLRPYETRVTIADDGRIYGNTGELVIVRIPRIDEEETLKHVQVAIKLAQARKAPILLILDGTGGRVVAGLNVASELAHSGLEVRCQVRRAAMSMNAFLFELTECTRSLYQGSTLVFHHPRIDPAPGDTEADAERKAEAAEHLTQVLCLGLAARTGSLVSQTDCMDHLHENAQGTWTVNEWQALALHLVDFVVPPGAK